MRSVVALTSIAAALRTENALGEMSSCSSRTLGPECQFIRGLMAVVTGPAPSTISADSTVRGFEPTVTSALLCCITTASVAPNCDTCFMFTNPAVTCLRCTLPYISQQSRVQDRDDECKGFSKALGQVLTEHPDSVSGTAFRCFVVIICRTQVSRNQLKFLDTAVPSLRNND